MRTPAENASLLSRLPESDVDTVPGPLKPGSQVDLGDGRTWTVVKLELRGGLGGAPWEHWALLTRGGHGRRWVQVLPPEAAAVEGSDPDALPAGDEADVLDLIRERLEMGRGVYGPLQVDADPRDFQQEAVEELLDGCVYLACRLLQVRHAWLYDNPEALASVRRGLAQAKEGKLKPFDLAAAQAVAEQCDGE